MVLLTECWLSRAQLISGWRFMHVLLFYSSIMFCPTPISLYFCVTADPIFLPLKYLIHQKMKWAPFFRANPISAKVMPSLISWFIFTHLVYMYIYYTNSPIVHLLPNHQLSYPSVIKHGGIIPPYFDDVPGESSISFVDFASHAGITTIPATISWVSAQEARREHAMAMALRWWFWTSRMQRRHRAGRAAGGDFWAEGRWDFWWNLMDSIEIKHHLYHPRKPFWKPMNLSD